MQVVQVVAELLEGGGVVLSREVVVVVAKQMQSVLENLHLLEIVELNE